MSFLKTKEKHDTTNAPEGKRVFFFAKSKEVYRRLYTLALFLFISFVLSKHAQQLSVNIGRRLLKGEGEDYPGFDIHTALCSILVCPYGLGTDFVFFFFLSCVSPHR
jgi:hypothetical protein